MTPRARNWPELKMTLIKPFPGSVFESPEPWARHVTLLEPSCVYNLRTCMSSHMQVTSCRRAESDDFRRDDVSSKKLFVFLVQCKAREASGWAACRRQHPNGPACPLLGAGGRARIRSGCGGKGKES